MSWNYVDVKLPLTYKEGNWDGKRSDEVLAEDNDGNKHIAVIYTGFIDGNDYADWFDNRDFELVGIIRWMEIPY